MSTRALVLGLGVLLGASGGAQSTPPPPASAGHSLVYASHAGMVVLVNAGMGGMSQPPATTRTRVWGWTGTAWRVLDEAGPPIRSLAGVAARSLAIASSIVERPRVDEDRAPGWTSVFRRPVWAAVSLAAALAVVVLGAWNLGLQDQNRALVAYQQGVVQVLAQAAQPGAQLAVLAGEAGGPSGLAAVAEDGTVAIVMRNLAPTSGSEVYEAWLIAGDLAPVPIGEMRVGADGTAALVTNQVPLGSGVTVALTLEPGPDSTAPTTTPVVAGQAKAQAS
jgi:hypothetical protein